MKSKKTLTNNILDLSMLKDFDFSQPVEIILPDNISPDLLLGLNMIFSGNFSVTYVRSDENCPHCDGKLKFKEYRSYHPNNMDCIEVKRYKCESCNKTVYPDFTDFTLPNCQFSVNIMHWYAKLSEIMAVPFEKASELFEALFNVYIAPSTLCDHYNKFGDDYFQSKEDLVEKEVEENQLKDKGVYNYDEHFPHQNAVGMTNLVMMDAETLYPYKGLLDFESNFDCDLIGEYFHDVLDDIPHEIMVTDGYSAYPSIIEDFGMKQQRCVFHMLYNAGSMIYPIIRKLTRNNTGKYSKLDGINQKLEKALEEYDPQVGRIAKSDKKRRRLHDLIQELGNEIRHINKTIKNNDDNIDELLYYLLKFSEIFQSEDKKEARRRLNILKNKIQFLPRSVATMVKRIDYNFNELTLYYEYEGIPKTNNNIELYFKTTLPGYLKRRYRTIKGLKRRLQTARTRWIHRVVLKKNTPMTNFFNMNINNIKLHSKKPLTPLE